MKYKHQQIVQLLFVPQVRTRKRISLNAEKDLQIPMIIIQYLASDAPSVMPQTQQHGRVARHFLVPKILHFMVSAVVIRISMDYIMES